MVFAGSILNGAVVLPVPVALPDGTEVRVEAVVPSAAPLDYSTDERVKTSPFADLLEFAGIGDLPEDFALNHDHYIHGAPKR